MNTKLQMILRNVIIGSLYIALTLFFSAISYGQVQFRISEVLIIFVLFNKNYLYGLTLGCLISNIFSPMAMYDIPFGTLATLVSLYLMTKVKNPFIAFIFPVLINAILVGIQLKIAFELPFFTSALYVGIGEATVLYLLGLPLFYSIRENNKLLDIIDAKIEIYNRPKSYFKLGSFFKATLITLIMLLMPIGENNLLHKDNFNLIVITIPILYVVISSLSFLNINKKIFISMNIITEVINTTIYAIALSLVNLNTNPIFITLMVFFTIMIIIDIIILFIKIREV